MAEFRKLLRSTLRTIVTNDKKSFAKVVSSIDAFLETNQPDDVYLLEDARDAMAKKDEIDLVDAGNGLDEYLKIYDAVWTAGMWEDIIKKERADFDRQYATALRQVYL